MANILTGEFDVVAELTIPAVNRILATLHSAERFPHSVSARVKDEKPHGSDVSHPTTVGIVDASGDAPVDPGPSGVFPLLGAEALALASYYVLDPIVNLDVEDMAPEPVVPSKLRGWAQLQLAAPTLELATGTSVTARIGLMARYFPDPDTSPLAPFLHGELRLTADVNHVASQVENVVDIDLEAGQLDVSFQPTWSSAPLSAPDLLALNRLVHNTLKTSLLPANVILPSGIQHLQLKPLHGSPNVVSLLMNMGSVRGNAAIFQNAYLSGSGEDFGFAVGVDFIRAALAPLAQNLLGQPLPPFSIEVPFLGSATYTTTLNSVATDLVTGSIVLTIRGRAHTPTGWAPDFDFTARLSFSLAVSGATAELVPGAVSLDTSSWVVNLFKGAATGRVRAARDRALTQTNASATVRRLLSADATLGAFLRSLFTPPQGTSQSEPPGFQLAYTSVEIRPAGIVLRGSLGVSDWPAPHVEFAQLNTQSASPLLNEVPHGPDYSALNSWIPGGGIQRFEWSRHGHPHPLLIDEHRFVFLHPEPTVSDGASSLPAVHTYTPLCLTLRGSRLTSSGPIVAEPVSGSTCGYASVAVINGLKKRPDGPAPLVALAHAGANGLVELAGHAAARVDTAGNSSPNLIVHFADDKSARELELLKRALEASGRRDAPTAILAVLTPEQLGRARYTEGVIYAEPQDGAWERVYGVKGKRRPLTVIVGPKGHVVWQHEGGLDSATLASAMRKFLEKDGVFGLRMVGPRLTVGQPSPNFIFEHAPGRKLTLRQLAGQKSTLVFWRSSSRPSLEAVRELQKTTHGARLLAVNDGEPVAAAERAARENGFRATLVTDPDRNLALAYGVSVWPTIVSLDASGLVRDIKQGRAVATYGEPTRQAQEQRS